MARIPSTDMASANTQHMLCEEEHILLRNIARESMKYGLQHSNQLPVTTAHYPPLLREPGASFVTLKKNDELRGCIGTLEARQPLVVDIVHNAYAAAFSDPRFTPVTKKELPQLELHLSVLTPAVPMQFASEADLLKQLRPNIDGLVLAEGRQRGTFLPAVWESLPDAKQFLQRLKQKAGLPDDYWSDTMSIARYTTESF